ncbi:MAG TPA: HEPN domain-containing protein [Chitinophagaceae bacterium]|nr:HEPN domain-containing protein [Chitinophagaceae bacterium]
MKVRFYMKDKSTLLEEWVKIAEEDLLSADALLKHDYIYPRSICFHCQQAAEKYLKAYLLYFDLDIIKTHDLSSLVNQLSTRDTKILDIINAASTLTPYAISVRYPDDFELISVEETKEAYSQAVAIKDYIRSKINL